ncbi:zinc metalloproteinase nas-36-like isoform X1 [Ruditapes philippinarum]|uniref:zinc metalloproteinase nas-36-like isoform X1 n=1 Tax=Ruditapes philippinarum TaxID=129788 RepID=UPI00295A78A9|nr:zinc metalloproteinase nas-36-like isoform X1 [Ruditapes philippinarum]
MYTIGSILLLTIRLSQVVDSGVLSTTSPPPDSDIDDSWKVIKHWPDGVIPYDLTDTMYDRLERGLILSAMRRWEYKTCVKFIPWTSELGNEQGAERYIRFFSAGNCFSRMGMQDEQPQLFGIGKGCLKMSTILHELGHTIGLVHEMERPDRDYYIDIHRENMNEDSRRNFETTDSKKTTYNLYKTPYDYKSIMHYGPKAWSKNKQVVLVTKDPAYQHVIGKANDISFFDALYVNRAYNCSKRCSGTLLGICQNSGFLGGPDCKCLCQDGYAGEFCETALPGFEHIIEWKCQKDWVFHGGKCYLFSTKEDSTDFFRSKASCIRKNATLVMFKDRSELEWLNYMIQEVKLVSDTSFFWVGMSREVGSSAVKWVDGTLVDTNLVSLSDKVELHEPSCALFDGETVLLQNCSSGNESGYICKKDFDSTCGGRFFISRTSQTVIQSPGFPDRYPEDIKCTYVLQTKKEARINITFVKFQLDRNDKDYIDVLLQNNVTLQGERYSGESLNRRSLETSGNLATVTFKTNGRGSGNGFKAVITEVNSAVAPTVPSLPFLDAIRKTKCMEGEGTTPVTSQQSRWSLSELFNIFKSMTFSKIL